MVKSKKHDNGVLFYDRDTGLNILLEEDDLKSYNIPFKPPEKFYPDLMSIALTNRCNLLCHHCYANTVSKWNDYYTKDDVLKLLKVIDKLGYLSVAFGGGEPLLFDGFGELIKEGYEKTNLCINFTTNGTLITQDFLNEIKGCVGCIRISLDGIGDVYNRVRGVDAWKKVYRGIKLISKNNIRFGFNTLLTSVNFDNMLDIADLARKVNAMNILFLKFKPHGRGEMMYGLTPSFKQMNKLPKIIERIRNDFKLEVLMDVCLIKYCKGKNIPILETRNFSYCGAGTYFVSLTHDGYVKHCTFSDSIMFIGKDFKKLKDAYMKRTVCRYRT